MERNQGKKFQDYLGQTNEALAIILFSGNIENKAKEDILNREIIEKQVPIDDFISFLKQKEISSIENANQLQVLIEEYRNKGLESPPKNCSIEETSKSENPQQLEQSSSLDDYSSVDSSPRKLELLSEVYTVSAQNLPENEISLQDLQISISNSQTDSKLYTLTTLPFEWVVQRKIEDFGWLIRRLTSSFPGSFIPPPLPKNIGKNKEDSLYKIITFLQRFINDVISHPLLKRSPIVMGFLKEDDNEKYKLFKKQIKKLKSPEKVKLMYSTGSDVSCDSSTNNEFCKHLSEYIRNAELIQKSIKKVSEQLENQLGEVVSTVGKLSHYIKELLLIQETLPKNKFQCEVYDSVIHTLEVWQNVDLERIKSIKDHFNTFFKYSYCEILPLKNLIKERDNWLAKYIPKEKKIKEKKEKLWEQGDVMKWWDSSQEVYIDVEKLKNDKDLAFSKMLSKETKSVEKTKNMYGFFNSKLQNETAWFLRNVTIKSCQNFKEYANHEIVAASRTKQEWEELIEKLDKLECEVKAE
ncbi:unnamed protein product [Blepharisma stoltei]|uniref:PX domain-containing protein n=1 Tax=Blepharisma stoltei TaxID=1481888 RepID=A0AAU9IYA9_9CILI|nr:unnamed protein product [Blepharisma stoltei]